MIELKSLTMILLLNFPMQVFNSFKFSFVNLFVYSIHMKLKNGRELNLKRRIISYISVTFKKIPKSFNFSSSISETNYFSISSSIIIIIFLRT